MNCISIPTMTVCQLIILLLRLVPHRMKIKTARPNKLTARFALVLSADSSDAKAPTSMTAIHNAAADGIRAFSGIMLPIRTPVCCHPKCIGFVMIVIGTWKKKSRSEMNSQSRKGMIQFLSLRCRTKEAIHQPVKKRKRKRWKAHRYWIDQ